MLELREIEKAYAGRRVLAGADLSVRAGEAVALVGGNGSGKTTTLRCIVGLAAPDGGSIVIDGIDALARPREARARVSYLPQKPWFPPTLTAREVIAVAARLRSQPAVVVDREIEQCGLTRVADRTVSKLSGGERQRVALAVTFVANVGLYVFDEPSASLEPSAVRLLTDRARELRRAGRAVLYSTHVASDIDRLATRVALLRRGRVQVLDDPALLGEPAAVAAPQTPGERALQQLEVEDEQPLDGPAGGDLARDGRGLRDWIAGAAHSAAGSR